MVTVKSGLFIVAFVTSLKVPAETCLANGFDLYGCNINVIQKFSVRLSKINHNYFWLTFDSVTRKQYPSFSLSSFVAFNFISPIHFHDRMSLHPFSDGGSEDSKFSEQTALTISLLWIDALLTARTSESSKLASNDPSFCMSEIPSMLHDFMGFIPVEFLLVKTSSGSDRNEDASFFDLSWSLNYRNYTIYHTVRLSPISSPFTNLESKLSVLRFESTNPESPLLSASLTLARIGIWDLDLVVSIL